MSTAAFPVFRIMNRSLCLRTYLSSKRLFTTYSSLSPSLSEFIVVHPNSEETLKHAQRLQSEFRPNLQILESNDDRLSPMCGYWYLQNQKYVLDSCPLDITQSTLTKSGSISEKWNNTITKRITHDFTLPTDPQYEKELNIAASVISRGCYLSRSHQKLLINHPDSSSLKKKDATLVTSVDFAMQALIIEQLATAFPHDKFIAEEDSRLLKSNPTLCQEVLNLLHLASSASPPVEPWTEERLFYYLDKGSYGGSVCQERVWALDPIDGTKGFVLGLHYCISIVLLDRGKPTVSVIGCPNLNLFQMLRRKGDASMIAIDSDLICNTTELPEMEQETALSHVRNSVGFPFYDRGSLYYAVSGYGAYARSLTMPFDASIQVHVSDRSKLEDSTLAEASETSRHDHHMTKAVASLAKMKAESIRIHSQCKYCIIGMGGAEGTIRYPPYGYVERVWDHAPGAHFVKEAGGIVTDLHGFELEVDIGRNLDHHVRGIVASNKKIHKQLLLAVNSALHP